MLPQPKKKALLTSGFRADASLSDRAVVWTAREARSSRFRNDFAEVLVRDRRGELVPGLKVLLGDLGSSTFSLRKLRRRPFRERAGREAKALRCVLTECLGQPATELLLEQG